jgi:hypothetical protein
MQHPGVRPDHEFPMTGRKQRPDDLYNSLLMRQLDEIKNFGPYMVRIMHAIGIFTEEDLLRADYRQIRDALLAQGVRPHLPIFYSIEMGLQDRRWNDIRPSEKKELRQLLDMEG